MFFGDKRRQEVSEDEIRTMVADNEELDDEEKRMIHEVMDLGDATAEEVMTPRVDMIMVGSDETVRQAIDRMRGTGYSRLPVFRDDDDDIIGIVRYKDLIDPLLEDKEDDLAADYVAEVGFVPESKSLLPLLNEMQTNRQQMVIVVDEYGGTAGLITIEDIVEEIVGEIVDETDFEDADIKALGAGSWLPRGCGGPHERALPPAARSDARYLRRNRRSNYIQQKSLRLPGMFRTSFTADISFQKTRKKVCAPPLRNSKTEENWKDSPQFA